MLMTPWGDQTQLCSGCGRARVGDWDFSYARSTDAESEMARRGQSTREKLTRHSSPGVGIPGWLWLVLSREATDESRPDGVSREVSPFQGMANSTVHPSSLSLGSFSVP